MEVSVEKGAFNQTEVSVHGEMIEAPAGRGVNRPPKCLTQELVNQTLKAVLAVVLTDQPLLVETDSSKPPTVLALSSAHQLSLKMKDLRLATEALTPLNL